MKENKNSKMTPKAKSSISFFLDILLLFLILCLPGYFREGKIPFNLYYAVFIVAWIFFSFIVGKYRFQHRNIRNELIAIILNAVLIWGLLSLFIISFRLYDKSYKLLFKQILLLVSLELAFRIVYYLFKRKTYQVNKGPFSYFQHLYLSRNNWGLMFLNLFWIFLAFMFLVWLKPASLRIYIPTYTPFLFALLLWEFILNLFTGKHLLKEKQRFRDFLIPIFRVNTLNLFLLAILIYIFHLFDYSRLILFGTLLLSAFFEVLFAFYISLHSKVMKNLDESESILAVSPGDEKRARRSDQPLRIYPDLPSGEASAYDFLQEQFKKNYASVYAFISEHINVSGIPRNSCSLFNTKTFFNIETREDTSRDLLINLQEVNNIKRINDYFALLNQKTVMGGYVVGCGKTIKGTYDAYRRRFPAPFGHIFYFFNFIFYRFLPKLPITREINYALTRGERRTLSKTEILGRLVYSGFKILACTEIDGRLWFIAGKVNVPYRGESPSYGPFISLKRVGKDGKIIKIYKFRTMHPYAEYLQDYVYEQNHLAKGGKLDKDFRITGWGRVFRKFWIDELPQLLNFLRGDIKLVGVRALSQHYFSLYPKEFREYRKQVKPGILPPFYVDMPETMAEIVASEKKYIDAYMKYGILTDIKYGAIIIFNIIIKGRRSS